MKFQLGDYVSYTNKKDKIELKGTIAAIDKVRMKYVIFPEEINNKTHLQLYRTLVSVLSGTTWVPNLFGPPQWDEIRALNKMVVIGFSSRNIKSMYLKYDPNQQPDEEDDL